jgi:iron complex outermembrane receptor protein
MAQSPIPRADILSIVIRQALMASFLVGACSLTARAADAPSAPQAPSATPTSDTIPPARSTTEFPTINVIGVSPVQGATLPENMVPYSVQSATSADFDRAQVLDATDYMNRHMAGVTINSSQGNPLQPDVQMRGFTGTPLLGGSEGISVYVDGVRVNEVFGDTINWDLIPEEAMSRMTFVSGANPIFGLNTLGGAIEIQTKNGFTDPGTEISSYAGSFGRVETTVQSGGNNGTWGYYLLANHFEEDGWRDLSNSKASSFLGTLSWRSDNATLDLHLSHSETQLKGNGAQAIDILGLAPKSVFTAPDLTKNYYSGITTQGTYKFNEDTLLSATLFMRQVNSLSYNGDDTDFDSCDDNDDFLCNDDGSPVLDQHGNPASSDYNAINNIGVRKQRSWGGSLQAVFKQQVFGFNNQFVAGVDADHGRVNYTSVLELATLIAYPSDPYSASTSPNSGLFVPDEALGVHIDDVSAGAYITDTLSLTDKLALTVSGRYNHTHVAINDTSGENPDLDGDHTFHRVNPAAGFTYQWSPAVNLYGGYSESTRAPTPVELTCASPDAPCKLPNDFVSDPPLKQVVAKSWEAGLRGTLGGQDWIGQTHWKVGFYRTTNFDDILFQTTGGALSNEGFYANVGDTRRQGVEASLSGKLFDGRVDWYANYSYLDAKFLTSFSEISANNPFADPDTGAIQVNKGDRIPSLPRNTLKLGADFALTQNFSVGGDVIYNSAQYLRGDEANLAGQIGGYAVMNLHASYRVNDRLRFFARVNNVFDRGYYNFGILGDATDLFPNATNPRFVSPGEPRGGWLGISIDL